MTEPLIPQLGYDAEALAAAFDQMAAQIRLNKAGNFGGAFVLVPPAGIGMPTASLFMNSPGAGLIFWQALKSTVDDQINQIKDQQRMSGR